jgi:UDP-glucose 6-dehydrogenase
MMAYYCKQIGVNANLFQEVENINMEQIQRVLELCKEYKRIGVYGIGYKVGSEILTDSQGWILVQELKKLGKHVEIYDPYNTEESTVKTEEELAKKSDIVILTLPYKTKIKVTNLWE